MGTETVGGGILVVDNYDSFTHNVVDLLEQLGAQVEVRRNDAIDVDAIEAKGYAGVILSPGPGRPRNAGICEAVVRRLGDRVPMLGICLGHQAMASAFGGRIVRAARPLHGAATEIRRSRRGLVRHLPPRFQAARYHSLVVHPGHPGRGMQVTCRSAEGEIMGLAHERYPLEGVQFHPESYLTPEGPRLLAAFLRRTGLQPRSIRNVVR